jgi:hypothetical protein
VISLSNGQGTNEGDLSASGKNRRNLLGNQETADPGESGRRPRSTTPFRREWHSLHWSGDINTSAKVGERKLKFDKKRKDRSDETLLVCICVCKCVCVRVFFRP